MSLFMIAGLLGALVAMGYLVSRVFPFRDFPFRGRSSGLIQNQLEQDATELGPVLDGLRQMMGRLEGMRSWFDAKTLNELDEKNKQELLDVWAIFLDHQVALSRVVERYRYFHQLSYWRQRTAHAKAFFIGYAAFVAAYASGLRFHQLVHDRPLFDLIFNDADVGRGIPAHAYDALSQRLLHMDEAVRLAAGYQYYQFLKPLLQKQGFVQTHAYLHEVVESSFHTTISRLHQNAGEWLPKHQQRLFAKTVLRSVLPLQKSVAETMGHTRVGLSRPPFITLSQIAEMRKTMQPGDILLERRNWYLSNIGIPGFWPHAALYLGTREELEHFFSTPEVRAFLLERGWADMSSAMRATQGDFFARYGENRFEVIEAKAEGVILTPLSESARADYVAVLRPELSRVELCQAVLEAIRHYGKPYDYGFDFVTDSSLVCSELVYKAYKSFLSLPLTAHVGRLMITATTFAQLCDEDRQVAHPRLRCVSFLDGREKDGQAFVSTPEAFCETWKRPKWDIAQG